MKNICIIKRLLASLFCLLVSLSCVLLPVSAFAVETGKKTVRVGWFESAFNTTDRFGRRSGYSYEYQQKIAAYTGWSYEYVTGSWADLMVMLQRGEIDLLSDVSYLDERTHTVLYSALPMGEEEYYAYISSRNTEIRLDDYTTFNGKKVGVIKGSVQKQFFAEWAKQYGINSVIVELTGVQDDTLQKLVHGLIDVYISPNTITGSGDVTPLCKIGSSPIYFAVSNHRPDLKNELDAAMNRIQEENRYYTQQLFEKYARTGRTSSFLTYTEKNWLRRHGMIRVGYRADYNPYCAEDKETGKLTGALQEYLTLASSCAKNAKIYFEPVAYPTVEDALAALRREEIDCVFPVNMTAYEGERTDIMMTDSLMQSAMLAVVRSADQKKFSLQGTVTAAIVKGNHYHQIFLRQNFPNWQIKYYNNSDECLKAVAEKKADCYLISMYRYRRIADQCEKYKLSSLSTGEDMGLSFALRRYDDKLYSILNKTVGLVSGSAIYSSLASHSYEEKKVGLAEFAKDNLAAIIAVVAVTAAIFLLLLLRSVKAEKAAMERQQLIAVAEHDNLSGLYNKNFFYEYASRYLRENPEQKMDSVALDIEQFHSLNELNGREFGDKVLRVLGEEIQGFLTEAGGIASRLEADRFNIYCKPQADYKVLLNRFQEKLNELSQNISIRLRMGVMPWQKEMEPVQSFDRAWSACSLVRGDKNHLMVYDELIRSREYYNQRLLNDLRRALTAHEFLVYYQPKFNIQCDPPRLASAEALIRWAHPDLGLIPPADFIPLFERNGQISTIDKYVWAEAIRQIAAWKKKFAITFPVSVNLSRVDVFDPNLENILDGLLSDNGLDCRSLGLEVTESAYTDNVGELLNVMDRLRKTGYKIEMDDFGSGYSSLNMLSSMPVDILKMDRAFIHNIEYSEKDFRLVKLIMDIARNLKMQVIAEGVETERQLTLLKNAGCDLVQGYYFSRPVPPEEFEKFIIREKQCRDNQGMEACEGHGGNL